VLPASAPGKAKWAEWGWRKQSTDTVMHMGRQGNGYESRSADKSTKLPLLYS
jgi:hypothetical protein